MMTLHVGIYFTDSCSRNSIRSICSERRKCWRTNTSADPRPSQASARRQCPTVRRTPRRWRFAAGRCATTPRAVPAAPEAAMSVSPTVRILVGTRISTPHCRIPT
uniref:(northern house mosquito) hypothetical protein n=1 Tax=Culex pipiens TaxID=7175 RepID=A0A8D8IE88_CULPI